MEMWSSSGLRWCEIWFRMAQWLLVRCGLRLLCPDAIALTEMEFYAYSVYSTHRWLGARLQYLHCISNGDTAVLHWAIDIFNSRESTGFWHCVSIPSKHLTCSWWSVLSSKFMALSLLHQIAVPYPSLGSSDLNSLPTYFLLIVLHFGKGITLTKAKLSCSLQTNFDFDFSL